MPSNAEVFAGVLVAAAVIAGLMFVGTKAAEALFSRLNTLLSSVDG